MRRTVIGLVCGVLVLVVVVWAASRRSQPRDAPQLHPDDRPIEALNDDYVSSAECRSCHLREHESWYASYHRTMTQAATPQTVLGDFDGRVLEHGGQACRLFSSDEKFFVEFDDPDGGPLPQRLRRPVVLATGSHHMQVYWYPTGRGRTLGQLPWVFLRDEQRWIPRQGAFLTPPDKPVRSETGRWNDSCCRCHTTHPQRRPVADTGEWDTHVGEFGISCEACHGPGRGHVDAMRAAALRGGNDPGRPSDIGIVHPRRLSADRSSQVCGQCHSCYFFVHRSLEDRAHELQHGFRYRPGNDLERDGYRWIVRYAPGRDEPMLRDRLRRDPHFLDDRFWPDGMVRVSGREYNAMLASACSQRGEMSCLTCHAMHQPPEDPRSPAEWADDQLRHELDGSRACLECHTAFAGRVAEHTHHDNGSAGSRCDNCHMPHTTYGLLKAIRSHRIDSPNLSVSRSTGRPNACNLCHLDKPLGWTAAHLEQWYGRPQPALEDEEHRIAAGALWSLSGDAGQRALAVWSMGWEPAQQASDPTGFAPLLAARLTDDYDAVRLIAHRSLRRLPGYGTFDYDAFAGEAVRQASRERVLSQWERSVPEALRAAAISRLFGSGEESLAETLNRWERQQDSRRIDLQE